jgi:hypothetical protein
VRLWEGSKKAKKIKDCFVAYSMKWGFGKAARRQQKSRIV